MIKKLFRQMIITQIISSMTVTICMLIDSIMIGRFLGVDSMSAYGLATPLLLVFAAFGSLISAGVQVVCGKTMGRGDREGSNACWSASLFMAALITAAGMALVLAFIGPLTRLLGAGEPGGSVYALTRDYIIGFMVGAPAFLLAQIMVPFMQIAGHRQRLVIAVIAMTLSDVAFDLLNVFVFRGGTLGMGLASSFSYYIALAIGIVAFLKKDSMFVFRRGLISVKVVRELIASGVPTVVNQVSMVLLVYALNRLLLSVSGSESVAAYSVISTVGNICYCFGSGIGAVAMMLASIFHSDRDRTSLIGLVGIMAVYAVMLTSIVTLAGFLAAKPLAALFLTDAETKKIAVHGLRLFILSIVPSSLNASFKNYYQGINRLRLAELVSVLQNFALVTLFAFALSRCLGLTGIWLGYLCGECATLIVISVITWRHGGRVAISAVLYSMLEPGFGADGEHCFERGVTSVTEATEVSRQLTEFCLDKGMDKRTANLIGLCVEEMTVNIVEHGFTKDRFRHSIDVRFVLGEDSSVIRIRDNCVNFDPTTYLELHETSDPAAHIGLRLVMKMVKEADYVNSLGLNNLTLVI